MRQVALFGCFAELQLAAATGHCGRRIILAMNDDTAGGERNRRAGRESRTGEQDGRAGRESRPDQVPN